MKIAYFSSEKKFKSRTMSNIQYLGNSFSTGYTLIKKESNLRTKLNNEDKTKYSTNVLNMTVVKHILKPTWINALTDSVFLRDLTKYEHAYPDFNNYASMLQNITEQATLTPVELEKDSQLCLSGRNSKIYLGIETVSVVDGKRERKQVVIKSELIQTAVRKYVLSIFKEFLPTALSSMFEIMKKYNSSSSDTIPIEDDLNIGNYYLFNHYGAINITKEQFLRKCKPIDLYYAALFNPTYNDNNNNLSGVSLYTIFRLCGERIADSLISVDMPLTNTTTIGSCFLTFNSGKPRKVIRDIVETKIITLPLILNSFTVAQDGDLFEQAESVIQNSSLPTDSTNFNVTKPLPQRKQPAPTKSSSDYDEDL